MDVGSLLGTVLDDKRDTSATIDSSSYVALICLMPGPITAKAHLILGSQKLLLHLRRLELAIPGVLCRALFGVRVWGLGLGVWGLGLTSLTNTQIPIAVAPSILSQRPLS